jgi:hypothetical protein
MKRIEIKKQITDVKTTTVFCDKCNAEIKAKFYDAFDCTIELRTGEIEGYSNDHIGDNYRVDLCENCAKFVFFELFYNNGIKVINENDE